MAIMIKDKLKSFLGSDTLSWWDRSYLSDWAFVVLIWILGYAASNIPPFEREFDRQDPLIGHPHRRNQISGWLNNILALWIPIGIVTITNVFRKSLIDIHHAVVSIMASRGMTHLITEFLKNKVGRLRPDFLARCKWDKTLKACAGELENVLDGRRSFPSGHASGVFTGMTFLSLWIAGQTAAWCFHAPTTSSSRASTRTGIFFLSLIPLFWASFVSVTRIEDYRHHKEDVIVGSLIGILSATIFYLMFWPNPFSASNFVDRRSTEPRNLYTDYSDRLDRRRAFELATFDADDTGVV